MRIVCVVDDAVQRSSPFWGEHGLAFLVEIGIRRLLFDTGQSGTILQHNLELLGIDPATIDAIAISHAHYDHTGGLPALLDQLRPGTPLYANPDLFRQRFSRNGGQTKRVGISLTADRLASRLTLILDAAPQEALPGLWTTGEISMRPHAEGGSETHFMLQGGVQVRDTYRDDMALVLDLGHHLLLLCGCCHAGLLNTLAHVERTFQKPIALIAGGLHLAGVPAQELQGLGELLAAMPALQRVYPNHCTGEAAFVALTQELGASIVRPCPAGTLVEL